MTLGQQIKKIRMSKDLSQPVLAESIGIEQSYLSKLENDKSLPSNDILRKLLVGLEVSLERLVEGLDQSYMYSTLIQIPDIETWLKGKRDKHIAFSRRILTISSALIALATTLFYTGYSHIIFSPTEYEYLSKGVVLESEPFNYFEEGAYDAAPVEDHREIKKKRKARYNPDVFKTTIQQGKQFTVEVEGGRRNYRISDRNEIYRIENAVLQILGVLMFSCGVLGFLYEWRMNRLK
jgi:transcriptional regulator with XRE-family HTH domain